MSRPTPKIITSAIRAQRAYIARKQEAGLVRVVEWVHRDDVAEIRESAERLRWRRTQNVRTVEPVEDLK